MQVNVVESFPLSISITDSNITSISVVELDGSVVNVLESDGNISINFPNESTISIGVVEFQSVGQATENSYGVVKLSSEIKNDPTTVPVTKAVFDSLSNKVDKENGKGLSEINFTKLLKDAYDGVVTWIFDNGKALLDHIGNGLIHLTVEEKNQGALKTGNVTLPTVKEVADKAQYCALDKGTVLYYDEKIFTTYGKITTNGTTVTITSGQFSQALGNINARITIKNENRIIASFVSNNVVIIDKPFSVNYTDESEWGVYSVAYSYVYNRHRFYAKDASLSFEITPGGSVKLNIVSVYFSELAYNGLLMSSNYALKFSNQPDTGYNATKDLGIRRQNAGILEIYDGVTNGNFRDIAVRNVAYSGALNFTSDARLKQNVHQVTDALKKCCDIASTIRHFEYKDQDGYFKGMRTSPIAQLLIKKGFGDFVSYRDPKDEVEGTLVGWTYKDETYEEKNAETGEIEVKTRRVPNHIGDQVMQVDNNFTPYALLGIAELTKENEALKTRLENIEKRLGINC